MLELKNKQISKVDTEIFKMVTQWINRIWIILIEIGSYFQDQLLVASLVATHMGPAVLDTDGDVYFQTVAKEFHGHMYDPTLTECLKPSLNSNSSEVPEKQVFKMNIEFSR